MTHAGHSSGEPPGRSRWSAGSTQMLTTLTHLRTALQRVRLPLEIPGRSRQPGTAHRDGRPARGLRAAAAAQDRRAAPDGRGRVHGRGQVDAGELARGGAGQRDRRAPADHALARARPPPRRRRLVRPAADPARPRAHQARHRRPRRAPAGRLRGHAAGARAARRTRHRLGRGAEPQPRRPAPRSRGPLAVRHLGGALRRPGAVGLPQAGRRPQCGGRDRARPHAAGAPSRR